MQISPADLPAAVAAYIDAANGADLDVVMACFSATALVNDQQREYLGHAAIRGWAAREIMADRVVMDVVAAEVRGANVAVTANVDGDYDKTGLPDPLTLVFYFTLDGAGIGQLIILRNKAAPTRTGLPLPAPLDAYFAAKNRLDVDGMLACFTPDATVRDDGEDMAGTAAIRAWMAANIGKFRVTADPIGVAARDGDTVVTALVSGNFPGSPAKLRYAFSPTGDRIAALAIG